jgi:hypothetical protein
VHKPLAVWAGAESSGITCHIIVFTGIEKKPVLVIGIECPELIEQPPVIEFLE